MIYAYIYVERETQAEQATRGYVCFIFWCVRERGCVSTQDGDRQRERGGSAGMDESQGFCRGGRTLLEYPVLLFAIVYHLVISSSALFCAMPYRLRGWGSEGELQIKLSSGGCVATRVS